MKAILIVTSLLLTPLAVLPAGTYQVTDLKSDYRVNPIGLEARHLRFFWRVSGGDQSAWQVQVATSSDQLEAGKADLWDSGKRDGAVTTQITYEGKPLASRQRVWWRVRAWDKTGKESLWSAPASFEMGLLNEADWRDAQWIGCDRDYKAPHPAPAELMGAWIEPSADAAVTCFFKDIQLSNKPIVSAMAYWGQSKLAGPSAVVVNFEKLEGFELAPMTRIMRSRKYGFCDLAFYLEPGKINRVELRFAKPPKNVAITIGMRIVFADGEEMTLKSGDDWQVQQDGKGKAVAAVKVVEPYGGAKYGKAMAFNQTNLPPAYFRKKIEVRSGLREGRLYLCALGQGQTYVNGVAADESLLSPPQSDYEEQAFYTTQDITGLLKPGVNALAVLLDGGWYHEVGGFGTVFSYGRPGLRALVALDYSDGKTEWIASGPDWQWKEGAIRLANIYLGERVDYRRDHDEWKSPDAGDGWKTAQVIPPCTPKLLPMDVVPVRRCGEIKPLKQWQLGSKTWRFDVGEMIHGWVKFTVKEPTGTTVRLRYVEHTKDGVMENIPVSHWWCHGVTQGDEIVCDGKPHVFETIFTPKSFRFVEISGVSGPPDDLVAVLVHTAAPALATFESSDPMLNRLFQNGMRTFRNYMNHMFGDIPRERCLWGAESIYSAIPATYCYDWAPNHRLMNLLWCTGAMTREGIPGDIGLGKRITTSTSSFIWSVTPLYLSSKMFEHYGDLDPGNRFYDKLRHLLRHTEKTGKKGGTIPIPNQLSDHAPVKDVPRNPANGELINTLVFFDAQNRFARMADALGKTDDAAHARDHAEKIRATVMGFYDGRKHTFGNGTHDSLALAYGVITDPTEQKALAASLVGYYRANGHQFDGGFMSYEIYPQLSRFGYADDAVKMLVNTKPPGPARSVKVYDATSFWEAYYLDHDYQMFRGLNFMATAHPIGWMLTDLAGIRFNADRLVLAPAVPRTEKLDWVKASVKTMHGTVESAWKLEGEKFTWNFTIPANVTAEICIPGEAAYEVNAGSYSINRRMARKSPVPVTATVKQSASSDGKEWKVSPGCAVQFADGSMIVTPGQGATQMLTTALPSFVGGKTTVRFRLKTVATEGGIVRLVSMNKGEKNARTMEFKLGPAGAWQEYTVAVPEFEGKPFSLWIGLAREKETLAFDEIAFVNANGNTLKQWSF